MKVSELSGAQLDYWVSKAEGSTDATIEDWGSGVIWCISSHGAFERVPFQPSTKWGQGGPIIEREKLELTPLYDMRNRLYWSSQPPGMGHLAMEDEAPLVAAMRAYVASKFGDDVEDLP